MSVLAPERATYERRGERAAELAGRHPFAAEILRFYATILPVQADAEERARAAPPALSDLPSYLAQQVMPPIIQAAVATGPEPLVAALQALVYSGELQALAADWLFAGADAEAAGELSAAERFLVRAAAAPVLNALPGILPEPKRPTSLTCPACGALPQVSFFAGSGEALVTGQRHLGCSRCGQDWVFPRMVCASCGESDTKKLPIYADVERFPHLRVDGCEGCGRYLVNVDLARDGRAIPEVDELAAVPLTLFAERRGLKKVTPNLVGL